jgi:hypothetical protein
VQLPASLLVLLTSPICTPSMINQKRDWSTTVVIFVERLDYSEGGSGMVEFREVRPQRVAGKASDTGTIAHSRPRSDKRRGERVNSRVPLAVEWNMGGELRRKEAQTRVIGPYGCLVVFPQNLEIEQQVQVTNLVSSETNSAVIVWRGHERAEGWELGIELINPKMDFWGLDQ